MPAISVLVPTFEQAAFLPRALGALRAQDMADWEAHVLDDGSADETPSVVARFAHDTRIHAVRWERNRGLGATLNAGLDLARSPFVAYLPSDDVWDATHLSTLLAALDAPADGALDDRIDRTGVTLAWTGVRHHGGRRSLDAPAGFSLQLVQAGHRRTRLRWPERAVLESDDLEALFWHRLRGGRTARSGKVTCEWTEHPGQRHKAIRESFDGGLNVFRSRYRVSAPLRFHSSDSGTVDEVERYRDFRRRSYPPSPEGLRILLVGELAYNPERVLALAERGHRLFGLWTRDGLGDSAVGPMPFGHVEDLPRACWQDAVRRARPDVVYALLNWRAVPFAHKVRRSLRGVPFVWHFKEAPQRSIVRGEWPLLADLVTGSDACLLASAEECRWFELALPQRYTAEPLGVLDGDLPKADWLDAPRSPKLSEQGGEPHTVVVGRPAGLDAETLVALARRGVHTHLYGLVNGPGAAHGWRDWLPRARAEAPRHVHVHPPVGPEAWVRELSRYDAGWLHRFASRNGGDVRAASWDDLNVPARVPVLLAAGLPLLVPANPGHAVAVERIANEAGVGLGYEGADDLAAGLHDEAARRRLGQAAWAARGDFTFDAHADRLVDTLSRVAGRPGSAGG